MNLLPLESWRQHMHYNPFHFWELANSDVPVTSACNTLVRKYAWQHADAVGRADIETAIEAAETRLQEYLGYAVAPRYVEKQVSYPHYLDSEVMRYGIGRDPSGRMLPVKLWDGYVQAVGVESLSAIGDVAVTLADTDGDGLNDTFTCSIATTETDPAKLGVYFTATDRLDADELSAKWRIQPVKITISGGTANIRGRSWLLVKPIFYEGFNQSPNGRDPQVAGTYVTNVTVAVRSTDPNGNTLATAQAMLLWETLPCSGWWGCCGPTMQYTGNARDPASTGQAIARVGIRDAKNGIVLPAQAVLNTSTGEWVATYWSDFREPDQVVVRYLAGWPLDNGVMSEKWQLIVARLATAELARRICACDTANQELYHWQFDLSRSLGANDESYQISPADLDNPFGTRRGQVWAWKQVRNLRLSGSVLV